MATKNNAPWPSPCRLDAAEFPHCSGGRRRSKIASSVTEMKVFRMPRQAPSAAAETKGRFSRLARQQANRGGMVVIRFAKAACFVGVA